MFRPDRVIGYRVMPPVAGLVSLQLFPSSIKDRYNMAKHNMKISWQELPLRRSQFCDKIRNKIKSW